MPWFKVDDKAHSHRKFVKAGPAIALWTVAGSWCADQLTDGFVPDYLVDRLMPGAGSQMAVELVECELWDEDDQDGEEGWRFRNWEEYQPTSEEVESKRAAARERMQRVRANKRERSREHPPNVRAKFANGSPYPDPTRPDPTTVETSSLSSDVKPSDVKTAADFPDEVVSTTNAVARMIAANGHPLPSKGTKASEKWLVEMDRLLRLGPPGQSTVEPPTADDVLEVAEWATEDSFWQSNIQSVPKLREKWSQLALKARNTGGSSGGAPTGLDAVMAAARRTA